MIPKDAPQADWIMYYHDTYMTHVTKGPCRVTVQVDEEHGERILTAALISKGGSVGSPKLVNPDELRILWPRPGAYNFPRMQGACFVGRRPQRHMKRSAYRDHYYFQWAPTSVPHNYMMAMISLNTNYWSVERFLAQRDTKTRWTSAAISSKIILYWPLPDKDSTRVIFLSESIGNLVDKKFIPHMEHDSRLPRIMRHLATVGIYL